MLFRIAALIALIASAGSWSQDLISDPIAEFLNRNPRFFNQGKAIEEVHVIIADISGDGKPEIFLSHDDMYVDRAGRTWAVYTQFGRNFTRIQHISVGTGDQRRKIEGAIRIRADAFHVGHVEGVEGTTLFSYWPAGGGDGGVIGIWLKEGSLRTKKVKDLLFRSEEYSTLFFEGKGEIVKAKVEDLATEAQRMALIGGPPPELTGGFVSRTTEEPETGEEKLLLSSQEAPPVVDVASIQASSSKELNEPTAVVEAAPFEEPEGSGWSGGMLVVSIGAVIFLLALAGYRVFSKKGRSGS